MSVPRTPLYNRLALLTRPFPNFDLFFIKPLRQRGVDLLHLRPGARVLDLGCGLGGSLPYLVNAVGPSGEVVGVEITPAVAEQARRRVARNGWPNVRIIEGDARTVDLPGMFDAALMFAAPDIFASPEGLDRCFAHLKPGARVAFFGARMTSEQGLASRLFRAAVARVTFKSTPVVDMAPWKLVSEHTTDLKVEELASGWMFLASATLPGG